MKINHILLALAFFNATTQENLMNEEHEKRFVEKYKSCKDFKFRPLIEIARDIDERRADQDNHFF